MKVFEERKNIYKSFKNYNEALSKSGFLYVYNVDDQSFEDLNRSMLHYVNESLAAYYGKEFNISDEVGVKDNIDEILSMPNITPNGMFLPKNETAHALDDLQKSLCTYLEKIDLYKNIEKMQTVRVLIKTHEQGNSSSRPYYTGKVHSDAWVGQQGDAILWLSTLMNEGNTLEYLEPVNPSPNFFDLASSFEQGQKRYIREKLIGRARVGTMAIIDHSCLHRTYQEASCRPRITITCGVAIKKNTNLAFNQSSGENYAGSYYDISALRKVGITHTFRTDETLEECKRKFVETDKTRRSAYKELSIEGK